MTREGLKKHWDVVKAWIENDAEIENRSVLIPRWREITDPHFHAGSEYRVKSQSRTRAAWVNIYSVSCFIHWNRAEADKHAGVHELSGRIACVPVTITWTEGEGLE